MACEPVNVHATCLILAEAGLLLRGPSGSGKSTLALHLLATWRERHRFAALVADDRVLLSRRGDAILAAPPATLAGLAELSGAGILTTPHLARARVTLIADLVDGEAVPRLPQPQDRVAELCGVRLARALLPARSMMRASRLLQHHLGCDGLTRGGSGPQRCRGGVRPQPQEAAGPAEGER